MFLIAATSSIVFIFDNASIVAFTTFLGLFVPIILALASLYPASSNTALAPPPAITPDPSLPGLTKTLAAPNLPRYSCGTVVPTIGTFTIFFLALSIAFL